MLAVPVALVALSVLRGLLARRRTFSAQTQSAVPEDRHLDFQALFRWRPRLDQLADAMGRQQGLGLVVVQTAALAAMAATVWLRCNGVDDMTNLARIQSGVVAEIISNEYDDVAKRYHPNFVKALVKCGDKVQPGWTYADGKFAPPPETEGAPRVARKVSGARFRAALAGMRRLDDVFAAISDPQKLELFRSATEFREDHPDIVAIAAELSIDIGEVVDRAEQIEG